jgi:hypothetical protein
MSAMERPSPMHVKRVFRSRNKMDRSSVHWFQCVEIHASDHLASFSPL